MLVTSALMAWSSRVGKLRARDRIIAELALRGDETVLDVGCGRGLLLVAAARHLTTGRALGIDLWQAVDQSGNRSAVTLANARREGVLPRVAVITGDMRRLPLADGTVDVVVSSLAIHNIPDKEGRMQAIRAIARVLKPHGRLALLDFQQTDEYVQALHFLGWRNVQLSGPSFMMFPPVSLVKGRKPI